VKTINVLSWGGGTQSTALLLKMLKGEVLDDNKKPIKLDYIMFADTKNESELVYKQIFEVQKYVKEKYDFDIIITQKNKELKPDVEVVKMIKQGLNYRTSEYADLYQSHILYFQGHLNSIDVMPFWTRNIKTGSIGKTPFKACTFSFKINQIMKELRERVGIARFNKNHHKINLFIGYSIDEISRVKPNPLPYAENFAPLVDLRADKEDCIKYVEKELGFTPQSSVCNMCYANDFNRVYNIYKSDKESWNKLLYLDQVMNDKPKKHRLKDDVFMFKWQADENVRLKNVDMEKMKEKQKKKYEQMSIFDLEQEMSCMGGCFL
jgi:uncharacterized protein YerC